MLESAFRLAFLLNKTISEISEMAWDEFVYWQAYLNAHPPDEGDNQRTAALLAQITNMAGKSLRKGKSVTASDFLGKSQKPIQSMEEQIKYMKSLSKDNG